MPIPSDNKYYPMTPTELTAFVYKTYGEKGLRQFYDQAPRITKEGIEESALD